MLNNTKEIDVLVATTPSHVGLEQKKPYVFEVPVKGGDTEKQFNYAKDLLGKELRFEQVFTNGSFVDVASISKGKGWAGPVTRFGVKRKQHKSRKSVREVGSLGPISPQNVMYTVPRAGQRGFHQRIEYNKRIMVIGNTENEKIKPNPVGGFKHYGIVKGDFIIVKGSVPGTYKRLIKFRSQMRKIPSKVIKPNILEIVV